MERFRKFLFLPAPDRNLLVRATLFVGAIRLGLWLMPFRTSRRLLLKMTRKTNSRPAADQACINRVVWAVTLASRYVPRASCLTQALAAELMLGRRGQPAHLHIGVAKGERGRFEAHAWVEVEGRVVIGSSKDLLRFTPLPLDGEKV